MSVRADGSAQGEADDATGGDEASLARGPTERPRTRRDCLNGPRPCPWVGCKHHLLELRELVTGRLVAGELSLPLEADAQSCDAFAEGAAEAVLAMPETCALDVADRSAGEDLEPKDVGRVFGVTRQRVNQVERKALRRVRPRVIARGLR